MEEQEELTDHMIRTEARIIMYLNAVQIRYRYMTMIGIKLNIDKSYVTQTLQRMTNKQWIQVTQTHKRKKFYTLTQGQHIEHAVKQLTMEK